MMIPTGYLQRHKFILYIRKYDDYLDIRSRRYNQLCGIT
jgi:hypothetical protein